MYQDTCLSIKDALLAYLSEFTQIVNDGDDCIMTVPINTLDDRWVDVTVVEKSKDYFVVHDSGKSVDELFLQGLSLSDTRIAILHDIAARYGVNFVDDYQFVAHCPRSLLQHSIWAVAQCSNLAMSEILRHKASVQDESATEAVGQIIDEWSKDNGVSLRSNVPAKGKIAQHSFDFVANGEHSVVAINVLNPTSGALARAQRYGYQALDLAGTSTDSWKKLAVLAKPDLWSPEPKRIVTELATQSIEFWHPNNSRAAIVNSLKRLLVA
jgi:hypothetical protein